MIFSSPAVRHKIPLGSALVASGAVGFLSGWACGRAQLQDPTSMTSDSVLAFSFFFILTFPWIFFIHLRAHGFLAMLYCAIFVGAAAPVGIWFDFALQSPMREAAARNLPFLQILQYSSTWGLLAAITISALYVTTTLMGRRIVVQDGRICEECAHTILGTTGGRCPECGANVGGRSRGPNRAFWRTGATILSVLVATTTALAWTQSSSTAVLLIAGRPAGTAFHAHMYSNDMRVLWSSVGVVESLDDDEMVLGILFDSSPEASQPAMQFQVLGWCDTPSGDRLPIPGEPLIIASLNSEQAAEVQRNGITPKFLEAIRSFARSHSWRAAQPGGAPSATIYVVSYPDCKAIADTGALAIP
jgi:hypothetical protein